jgi:hypothetical protein
MKGRTQAFAQSGFLRTKMLEDVRIILQDSTVCFFIDGLDEFAGSPEELLLLIQQLRSLGPHVKLCMASRPWNVFRDAFGQEANLRVEDLTYNDIKTFVTSEMRTSRHLRP